MDIIRRAKCNENNLLKGIAKAAYEEYIPLMDKEPAPMLADFAQHIQDDVVFVIEDEAGHIAGYAVLQIIEGQWWLDNIAIHPSAQGRGYGAALLAYCERYSARHTDTLYLYTNIVMTENRKWYERAGYILTKQALIQGYERFYFEKTLR